MKFKIKNYLFISFIIIFSFFCHANVEQELSRLRNSFDDFATALVESSIKVIPSTQKNNPIVSTSITAQRQSERIREKKKSANPSLENLTPYIFKDVKETSNTTPLKSTKKENEGISIYVVLQKNDLITLSQRILNDTDYGLFQPAQGEKLFLGTFSLSREQLKKRIEEFNAIAAEVREGGPQLHVALYDFSIVNKGNYLLEANANFGLLARGADLQLLSLFDPTYAGLKGEFGNIKSSNNFIPHQTREFRDITLGAFTGQPTIPLGRLAYNLLSGINKEKFVIFNMKTGVSTDYMEAYFIARITTIIAKDNKANQEIAWNVGRKTVGSFTHFYLEAVKPF